MNRQDPDWWGGGEVWEAQQAGALFYHPPHRLDYEAMVDPLLREACRLVNSTGWIWTAETCQGHPDYDGSPATATAWPHQVGPYFRVVLREHRLGEALAALYLACARTGEAAAPRFEVYPRGLRGGWHSFPIYIKAHNVETRDRACAALTEFGRLLADEAAWGRSLEALDRDNDALFAAIRQLARSRGPMAEGARKFLLWHPGPVWRTDLTGVPAEPWPPADVLERLADAAEHLLEDHDCDRHGHELDREAARRAREIVAGLRAG